MQSTLESLMSGRCERSSELMMPTCHSGDGHADGSNPVSEKLSIPPQQNYPNMLSDFNTPYLSMAPMLTFTDNYEDLDLSTACGQWDSMDPASPPLDSSLSDGLYLDTSVWGQCLDLDLGNDALDEVLTGSKEALSSGPTLAALNASEKPELGDLDLDDFPLPEEISSQIRSGSGLNTPLHDSHDCLSIPMLCGSGASSNGSVAAKPMPKLELHSESPKLSTLHELLVQDRPSATMSSVAPQMVPQDVETSVKEEPLSPKDPFCDLQKRWPRMRLRTCTLTSVESFGEETAHSSSSVSDYSEDVKGEVKDNDSHDEGFDSDLEDSDHYDCSDADSVGSWDLSRSARSPTSMLKARKKERYFWQYNLQAKGPKGNRMPLAKDALDPHMLDEVTDPVFSPTCQVKGIKHTRSAQLTGCLSGWNFSRGKARRGDGNDLTPNPMKLYQIGQELRKLNRVINDLTPVSELPFNVRPKSRKEKNKLASRACRLKKKAQHEANKLKLFGLEQEHRRLMYVLGEMRKSMLRQTGENKPKQGELMQKYENLTQHFLKTKVAGNTVEFVNRVLETVTVGSPPSLVEKL